MIKEYGGIATVIVGNARKAMTIVLSFLLFPKPGSIFYIFGGILVFGGLTLNAYSKEMGWGKPVTQTPAQQSGASSNMQKYPVSGAEIKDDIEELVESHDEKSNLLTVRRDSRIK